VPSPITITPLGAVGEVTGSGYLVQTPSARVLVDFGSFQGTPDAAERNLKLGPLEPVRSDPRFLDAIVLTHAHTDHSGRLPLLFGAGCRTRIWSTPASLDLAVILLRDSAAHAAEDLARRNRHRRREGLPPLRGTADREDIDAIVDAMKGVPYGRRERIAPGVSLELRDSGHILGSTNASLEVELPDGTVRRLVFSGDVGPKHSPILRDPVPPSEADCIVLESTYGDREQPHPDEGAAAFVAALRDAIWQQKLVLIPAFAIGRTQTLLYRIACGIRDGALPECPIWLDSPMASKTTEVYRNHQQLYDEEMRDLAKAGAMRTHLRTLRVVDSVDESKALNETAASGVIIAGGGMCEGGRIVHHLKHHLGSTRTEVFIVGYMAERTLGRALADGDREVVVDDVRVPVRASIRRLGGFSAHAGRSELLDFLAPSMAAAKNAKPKVVLVHGEEPQRTSLAAGIAERYGVAALRPLPGDVVTID
jgi:metallo-beta-lactamase family protein